jgi:hypothetical protein
MPPRRSHRLLATLLAVAMLAGCNDYPVHSLLDSFEARVTSRLTHEKAIKLDFLWVIDHSPSMCSHQLDLAKGFQDFVGQLQAAGQIDAQMAVVSVQQIPDVTPLASGGVIQKVGEFLHRAETKFPPNCIERFKMPCTDDSQCQKGMNFVQKPDTICAASSLCTEGGSLTKTWTNPNQSVSCNGDVTCDWRCKHPAVTVSNDNCSINSYCQRHCKNDQECRDVFEPNVPAAQQRMKCYHPGGTPSNDSGCQFPAPTEDCPPSNELPSVLKATGPDLVLTNPADPSKKKTWKQLDLFRCIATVGASQTQESKFEGGLRSAWLALDPNGPNCPKDPKGLPTAACQYKQLVRPDAYLVIVVVSDDDDCSVNLQIPLENKTPDQAAALKAILPKEVWDSCQQYGDGVAGNPWLNEGNCEYLKGKPTTGVTVCPCDCRAMAAGSPEQTACKAQVAKDRDKYTKADFRFAGVNEFVNKFRTLKNDPGKVIFTAVTGYSTAPGGIPTSNPKSYDDGVAYYKSKIKNIATGQTPYVCAGTRGDSGFGTRYVQMANAFKDNGLVLNICEGADFGQQLSQIAQKIQLRVVNQCLPAPPVFSAAGVPTMSVVLKEHNDPKDKKKVTNTVPLKFVEDCSKGSKYDYCLQNAGDCLAGKGGETLTQGQTPCKTTRDCTGSLTCIGATEAKDGKEAKDGQCLLYNQAIFFSWVLNPLDEVEINYGADLGIL